ncbi:hypothetical protein MTO96_049885, partial [Rhipicephalus appendiculatus]
DLLTLLLRLIVIHCLRVSTGTRVKFAGSLSGLTFLAGSDCVSAPAESALPPPSVEESLLKDALLDNADHFGSSGCGSVTASNYRLELCTDLLTLLLRLIVVRCLRVSTGTRVKFAGSLSGLTFLAGSDCVSAPAESALPPPSVEESLLKDALLDNADHFGSSGCGSVTASNYRLELCTDLLTLLLRLIVVRCLRVSTGTRVKFAGSLSGLTFLAGSDCVSAPAESALPPPSVEESLLKDALLDNADHFGSSGCGSVTASNYRLELCTDLLTLLLRLIVVRCLRVSTGTRVKFAGSLSGANFLGWFGLRFCASGVCASAA